MYGFIYITTNKINSKKYIGKRTYQHSGWRTYLGSGIYLRNAINKYGKENFTKEIIDEAKTPEELTSKEIYWINYYNAIESSDFYNIAEGGVGGNTYAGKTDQELKEISKKLSKSLKGKVGNFGNRNGMYGKKTLPRNNRQNEQGIGGEKTNGV